MILHEPFMTIEAGEVCIAARFELRNPLPYLPVDLWYRFSEEHASRLAPRADAFAPTALMVAMYIGESLRIRGPISPRLAYSLYEYRNIYHSWAPKLFQSIDIDFEQLLPVPGILGESAVATAFSGGVDSFYTLWAHLPENQTIPDARVTHGLFVRGFDMRLEDESSYQYAAGIYTELYRSLGLELILAATNAHQFFEFRIDMVLSDGPPLIGAALLMSPFLRRFYTPSGMSSVKSSYLKIVPSGTNPLCDHLLSTETLEVVHHGASVQRFDKLNVLVDWPVTHHHLRVCADKQRLYGLQNCSSCHKCYRTTTILSILNALPNYHNFSQKLSPGAYLRWGLFTHLNVRHAGLIRNRAFEYRRFGMAFMIQVAIILSILKDFSVRLFKRMLSKDQLYWLKRRVYQPESTVEGDDR